MINFMNKKNNKYKEKDNNFCNWKKEFKKKVSNLRKL